MYSLIIPNYNPGSMIDSTWQTLSRFVAEQSTPWEVLFVCDGCTDGTVERLNRYCQKEQARWCRVLSYYPNQGKGFAVRTGLAAARGDIRVFTDVDLAYSYEDLRAVDAVRQGSPIAITSREHPDSTVTFPYPMLRYVKHRRFQSHVFGVVARSLMNIPQRDTQAGLKAFSAYAVNQLLPYLACNGFGFDCEILLAAKRLNLEVAEVPVSVRHQDAFSTTSMRTSLQMVKQLWQIRRRWKQGLPATVKYDVKVQESGWLTDAPLVRAA